MSSIKKESLEERLERIRKKNEEIEKKHKLIEVDIMNAKKQNALVDIKTISDWPKEHKFDKLDITFDVSEAALEAEKAAKMELQHRRALKAPKFTDIPPDPTTFLADEERDGVIREQNKDMPRIINKGRALTGRKKFPKSASQNDFVENVGKSDPNWRCADDTGLDEKFTNLTVSVSQDGEFKSVRLSQKRTIGSGRVGPRQIVKTQFQPMTQNFDKYNALKTPERKKSSQESGNGHQTQEQRNQQWKGNNNYVHSHNKPNQSNVVTKTSSVQDRLKRITLAANVRDSGNPQTIMNCLPDNDYGLDTSNYGQNT